MGDKDSLRGGNQQIRGLAASPASRNLCGIEKAEPYLMNADYADHRKKGAAFAAPRVD
jgi:hypothetical protein